MLTANWQGRRREKGEVVYEIIEGGRKKIARRCIEAGRPGVWETIEIWDLAADGIYREPGEWDSVSWSADPPS